MYKLELWFYLNKYLRFKLVLFFDVVPFRLLENIFYNFCKILTGKTLMKNINSKNWIRYTFCFWMQYIHTMTPPPPPPHTHTNHFHEKCNYSDTSLRSVARWLRSLVKHRTVIVTLKSLLCRWTLKWYYTSRVAYSSNAWANQMSVNNNFPSSIADCVLTPTWLACSLIS